jgi:hypothetical protein
MSYDKMPDFIETIFNVFNNVNYQATTKNDTRLKFIALLIMNYLNKMAKENEVDLKQLPEPTHINLIPFFEYITCKNIELFEFDKIKIEDIDISKNEDIERFVLSHIYYLTQK